MKSRYYLLRKKVISMFLVLTIILSSFGSIVPAATAAEGGVTLNMERVSPDMVFLSWDPYMSGMPGETTVRYSVYRSDGSLYNPAAAVNLYGPVFPSNQQPGPKIYWEDRGNLVETNIFSYKVLAEAVNDTTGEVLAAVWSDPVSATVPQTTLTGMVYAPDGITPLEHAWVVVHTENWDFSQETSTNAEGRFKLAPPNGNYVLEINQPESTDYGQAKSFVTINTGDGGTVTDTGKINLPMANVFGKVYAPDGITPVNGAEMTIRNDNWTFNQHNRTDQNGNFRFAVPVGDYLIEARPGWDSPSPFTASLPTKVTVGPNGLQGITVQLTNPAVTGVVYDADGITPVMNAPVQIHTLDWSKAAFTMTDNNGRFAYGGLTNGAYIIDIQKPHQGNYLGSGATASVNVAGGPAVHININLERPSVIGTIYMPDGITPVPNAWVNVYNDVYHKGGPADEQGKYAIAGLSNGDYTIEAYPPWGGDGLIPTQDTVTVPGDFPVTKDINLGTALKTINVTVYKPGNIPVSNANVFAYRTDGFGQVSTHNGDANGHYQLKVDVGNWEVQVAPDWGKPGVVTWVNTARPQRVVFDDNTANAESASLTFTVTEATGTIDGQINLNGVPSNKVFVDARDAQGMGNGSPVDELGNFNIKVPPGTYEIRVFVDHPDYGNPAPIKTRVAESGIVTLPVIDLPVKDKTITGKVVLPDGTGVSGLEVFAWQPEGYGWANAVTNTAGEYTLKAAEGKWQVMVFPNAKTNYFYNNPPREVAIGEADDISTVNFNLTIADATVSGRILHGGNVLTTMRDGYVWTENASGEFVSGVPIENGTFNLKLPAGTYSIKSFIPPESGYTAGSTSITVTSGVSNIDISVVSNDKTITGTVYGNGLPLAGEDIIIYAVNDAGYYQWSKVDNSGQYTLNVSTGTWHLGYYIESPDFIKEPLNSNAVVVGATEAVVTKDITIRGATNTISGTVYAGGIPRAGVMVFADSSISVNGTPKTGKTFTTHGISDNNGNFSLRVPDGQYVIGAGMIKELAELDFLRPDLQTISATGGATVSGVAVNFKASDVTINGQVTLNGNIPEGSVFITAWSDKGANYEGNIDNGAFTIKATAGDKWYVDAIFESDTTTYTTHREITTVSGANTLDLALAQSSLILPQAESVTFDASKQQIITLSDGTIINIPAGAIAQSGSITITAKSTLKMPKEVGNIPVGVGYDLRAYKNENGQLTEVKNFLKPIAVTFKYDPDYLASLGIDEQSLVPSFKDELNGTYQDSDRVVPNFTDNTITIYTTHFTLFTLVTNQNTTVVSTQVDNSQSSGSSETVVVSGNEFALNSATGGEFAAAGNALTVFVPKEALQLANNTQAKLIVTEKFATDVSSLVKVQQPGLTGIGKIFELEVFETGSNNKVTTFKEPITLSFSYDGLSLKDQNKLGLYYLDEAKGKWIYVGGKIDKNSKTIKGKVKHFTKFALMEYSKTFNDISTHWAKLDIEYAASKHIIRGVTETNFQPQSDITRAQFAVLLVKALGLDTDNPGPVAFADVKPGDWFYKEVATAVNSGIVVGIDAKTFAPNAKITREQMAVMISKALKVTGVNAGISGSETNIELARFNDKSAISQWAIDGVAIAVKEGIIGGRTTNAFVAEAKATRAEAAVMIKRLFDKI